jgi:Zn-dependent protease
MNSVIPFIQTVLAYAVPVLMAIVLGSVAHAHVSRHYGDSGPADAGRTSFNPLQHIDPFGTILLPLLLLLAGVTPFAYPKALPPHAMRWCEVYPHMTLIALSGPAANFVLGITWVMFLFFHAMMGGEAGFLRTMGQAGMSVSAAFVVFNMLPVPPFAGGRAIAGLLPLAAGHRFVQIERYGLFVTIGIVLLLQLSAFRSLFAGAIDTVIAMFVFLVKPFFPL